MNKNSSEKIIKIEHSKSITLLKQINSIYALIIIEVIDYKKKIENFVSKRFHSIL